MIEGRRLVVVSNRLPVTLSSENGAWEAKASSGRLATAMEPILKQTGGLWIGWAGDDGNIDRAERDRLLAASPQRFSFVPVEFPPGTGAAFYKGYPNQAVWPLFHVFPSRMNFEPASWRDYVQGNLCFADQISSNRADNDVIWIHDYHLMLLPGMIRERDPRVKIGFFLHIPFPSSEVFSLLPHGNEVLCGLLGADLIAFHTHQHLQQFRTSLQRGLGIDSTMEYVEHQGRKIRLQALPIGIEPDGLSGLVERDQETRTRIAELREKYAGRQVIVAVDRLDYTKGIPERMKTWRSLLRRRSDLNNKAVMIQVAVPSREGIGEYQNLSSEINELVGEINGEFGTPEWNPIVYLRHAVDRVNLAELYAIAEVAWVTPLRDGMNLVAKEYCACKPDGDGVLVLSQFAGAAAEMGEALLVNPYDEEQVANVVERALSMPGNERARRMNRLRERVLRNHAFDWAERFLSALGTAEPGTKSIPDPLDLPLVSAAFGKAARRVIILDYDGTLVPIENDPASAAIPSDKVLALLSALTADKRNTVAVVSGRPAADLQHWLTAIPGLCLAAEHGAVMRTGGGRWHLLSAGHGTLEWKARIRSVLQHFVDRAPGSFIEEKEYSVVWHYRRVEPEFGRWLATELTAVLEGLLSDTDARPLNGRKIVEVRPVWANKGLFTSHLLVENSDAEFCLAAGDDTTDEDIFGALAKVRPDAVSIHVGTGHSRARYRVKDPVAVLNMLESFTKTAEEGSKAA